LQRFQQLSQKTQSLLLKKLDWSQLTPKIQEKLLKEITSREHWQHLAFNKISALNDDILETIIQKSLQLLILSLKSSTSLMTFSTVCQKQIAH